MRRCSLVVFLFMFLLGGCADARLKRQASLLNVKTHVARDEYNAAPTPEAKLVVADAYFRNAADMTQIVENGLFGRPPTAPVVLKP